MKNLMHLYKLEVKLAIREFSVVLFGILIPMGIMLLLGFIYKGKNVDMINSSFSSVVTIGICATGLMGIPIVLASYREKKILKQFQVTPVSPIKLLMAQLLCAFTFALVSSTGVFIIAKTIFAYTMKGNMLNFFISYLVLSFCIYSIGLLIGSVSNSVKTVNILTTLFYFPMFFLSGATIPYEILPKPMQLFANVMPLTQGIKLLKIVSTASVESPIVPVTILLTIGIICSYCSIKFFKYDIN